MTKTKNRGEWVEETPNLDISSLIDVCFLLLIYFLIATSIQKNEQDLKMRLPSKVLPSEAKILPMLIEVDTKGAVHLVYGSQTVLMDSDTSERTFPNVSYEVETYNAACNLAGAPPSIQVKVADHALQQRVIDVLNTISAFDIKDVTFINL